MERLYRKHLDCSERKEFDEMFVIPRIYMYMSACSDSVSLVRTLLFFVIILFPHYKELMMEIAPQIGIMRESR